MTPIEAAIVACLTQAQRRIYLRDIQSKLKRSGHWIERDDLELLLVSLQARGLANKDRTGWRASGNVREATGPPQTPLCDIRTNVQTPLVTQVLPSEMDAATEDLDNDDPPPVSVTSGGRWQRMRRLLAYYRECLIMEDAPEIKGFLDSIDDQWLPVVGSVPWDRLRTGGLGFTISLQDRQGRFQANRARRGEDMSLYLGYPIKVVKKKGRADEAFAVPIFVQPVEANWNAHSIHITPEGSPTVNSAWATYAFKDRQEREGFYRLVGLGVDDDGTTQAVAPNLNELAARMGSWFGDNLKSSIDPFRLDIDLIYDNVETGIYNRAVLMLGPKLKYTKSLLRELSAIASWSDDDIERSALRFLLPSDTDVTGQPWPWTPHKTGWAPDCVAMNNILFGAQRDAVVHANSRPVTVITGPPGTGKSEVVRAILVNQLLRGRPTLMASRNHGAIEAVVPRLNELGNGEPVVIRASSPNLRARNDWKDQLRTLLARPHTNNDQLVDAHLETAARLAGDLAAGAELLRTRTILEQTYAESSLCEANCTARAATTTASYQVLIAAWKPEHTRFLEELRTLIGTTEQAPSWIRRLLEWLFNRRSVTRTELVGQIVSRLPPVETSELDRQIAIWSVISDAAAAATRLSEIEQQLANLSVVDDTAMRKDIEHLRIQVCDLVRLLAGGAAAIKLDHAARQRMRNLWAGMQNFSGKKFNAQLREEFPNILAAFPLWSVTNLSVKSAIPLIPGVFDLVVIDEASQCDIPSVIPLLARARRAVIVGDPMQLTHITKLAPDQEQVLLARHHLTDFDVQRFSYRLNSCYALGESAYPVEHTILLDVHLRCHAEIAEFAGKTFYRGVLRIGTDHASLKAPSGMRTGIHWTDVVGPIEAAGSSFQAPLEVDECVKILRDLQEIGYSGTVGVVTPFRPNATRIQDAVEKTLRPEILERWNFLSSTAHGFQGDERDLMLYSLCCGDDLSPTSSGWLASPEGRNLMNVAITRARAVLHVIGNQSWAESSGIPHLASLARSCRARSEHVAPSKYESVWEERFDTALRAAGIHTVAQHPVAHRRLDLAVLHPVKLDIEVDGESTHRAASGRRKDDDYWRDIQMAAMGWRVLRFWVYELRDDMACCVARVKAAMNKSNPSKL